MGGLPLLAHRGVSPSRDDDSRVSQTNFIFNNITLRKQFVSPRMMRRSAIGQSCASPPVNASWDARSYRRTWRSISACHEGYFRNTTVLGSITGHEFSVLHSSSASARRISPGGISSPSTLAVLRLTTISSLVGCSTGMSAGLAPFKSLAAIVPACRHNWTRLGP